MIIDAHAHIEYMPGFVGEPNFSSNLMGLLREMQKVGIDHTMLIASCFKEDGITHISTRSLIQLVANAENANNIENVKNKISIIGSIDILDYAQSDLSELEQWLKEGLIKGVKLYTGYQHFYPSDPRCVPVYELCIKYDVPVMFHSGNTSPGFIKNPKIKYSHPLQIDDVATDYPELKIVIAHLGNPWLVDTAEILYKNPNVYADISGLVSEGDIGSGDLDSLRSRIKDLLIYVGANKLLFGTDYPLCAPGDYIGFARSLRLSKDSEEELMFKNSAKLFKLPLS